MTPAARRRLTLLTPVIFLLGALLIYRFSRTGPEWAPPTVLIVMGVTSALIPRPMRAGEGEPGVPVRRRMPHRWSIMAVVAGVALLMRVLGYL